MTRHHLAASTFASIILAVSPLQAAEGLPDIRSLEPDLEVPMVEHGEPVAGRRVFRTARGWQDTAIHHALYLPMNWKPGVKLPVLVEYPGNGGYRNAFGDVSNGLIEQCRMGYGISAGADYIWLSMPFVGVTEAGRGNRALWWGDADETAAYCVETVREVCREFGGDERAVVLCGFSRGAIACNYIGLRNNTIAALWRAFICHSHYDGVQTNWPYADADRASALTRLRRLKGRPQFISHERSVEATQRYLEGTGVPGDFTFADFPFRNHTDLWTLRDTELRRKVRAWLRAHGLPAP
jgi:hypothetical protein